MYGSAQCCAPCGNGRKVATLPGTPSTPRQYVCQRTEQYLIKEEDIYLSTGLMIQIAVLIEPEKIGSQTTEQGFPYY